MPRKEKKPPRLSGTIKDIPLREYVDEQTSVKGGASSASQAASESRSPRDASGGLSTGKRG